MHVFRHSEINPRHGLFIDTSHREPSSPEQTEQQQGTAGTLTLRMNYLALATDYDGTLATHGEVAERTIAAMERLRDSGRKIILVTGRQLDELLEIFPRPELFEWIVAENGAELYCPKTRSRQLLCEPVPPSLPDLLRQRGIGNLQVGQGIVATWLPNEHIVLDALHELGLDRQIIFNKDAVMVLPTGVNKASGLTAALMQMKISHHNTVSVGDAENDLPMLQQCQCGTAVSNALDSVKAKSDLLLQADHGAGVEELIEFLLRDDLQGVSTRGLLLGCKRDDDSELVYLPALGKSVLVAGPSGSGKSSSISGLLERMAESAYQICIMDPEGDYESFEYAINFGNPHYAPAADDVIVPLERMNNIIVNLLGVPLDLRPQAVSEILRKLMDLRERTGRPHWFVIDEAHHIFPCDQPSGGTQLRTPPSNSLLITVHPGHIRREALEPVDVVIAVGKDPHETLADFCEASGAERPKLDPVELKHGEVLLWSRSSGEAPVVVVTKPGKAEHKRHVRKYAEGDLGAGSFVFTGPEGKLKLVAQNLTTFLRMAEGVDDETWAHHLRAHHISEWCRWIVKNRELADIVKDVEDRDGSPEESRRAVAEAIRVRYTLPE